MRVLLCLIGIALWYLLCSWWYLCKICGCCDATQNVVAPPSATVERTATVGPLVFKWSDANAITSAAFPQYKDSILRLAAAGDTLVITGFYTKDEAKPANFANMGLARAEAAKALWTPPYDAKLIKTTSALVDERGDMRTAPFNATAFGYAKMIPKENETTVVEKDEQVIIYFPTNSSQKERNKTVEEYLDKLSKKHKNTKATFLVTGHTDSDGSEDANYNLALRRAKAVQQLLEKRGIAASRVTAESKGETQPAADNATPEGKRLNRRTTIDIKP